MAGNGKSTQITERRIDAHEVNRSITNRTGFGRAGDSEKQWGSRCFFPECELAPMLLFAQMPTLIAPEDDDCVIAIRALVECSHQSANHCVGKRAGSEITLHRLFPTTGVEHRNMVGFPPKQPTQSLRSSMAMNKTLGFSTANANEPKACKRIIVVITRREKSQN